MSTLKSPESVEMGGWVLRLIMVWGGYTLINKKPKITEVKTEEASENKNL